MAKLIPVIITLSVTCLLMIALRPLAQSVGLVDRPGGRKRHEGAVPIVGGAAMFIAVSIGISITEKLTGSGYMFLAAGGFLVLVGLIDDRFSLATSVRLAAQLIAILIMAYGANLMLRDIGDPLSLGRIELGPFALLATCLIFMSAINAFNLIDGLDGLAGSMALIAVTAVTLVAAEGSDTQVLGMIIGAAILGYLFFNFPFSGSRPLRSFMGDAGATFLGMSIVWLTASITQGPERIISPVIGLWFVALPIYDLFSCFVCRLLARKSPFEPGRDHFHHILGRSGMHARKVVGLLVSLQVIYAAVGLAGFHADVSETLMFACWALLGIVQRFTIRTFARIHRQYLCKVTI